MLGGREKGGKIKCNEESEEVEVGWGRVVMIISGIRL